MRKGLKRLLCAVMSIVIISGMFAETSLAKVPDKKCEIGTAAIKNSVICKASSKKYTKKNKKVKTVKISKKKKTLKVGKSFVLKLKKGNKTLKVKWKSSKKKIAKVSKNGKVTALKKGKCVISARYKAKKYKCVVTVKKAKKNKPWEQPYEETKPVNKGQLKNNILIMDSVYEKNKNMIYSPLSLNMALGIIANGAGEDAKNELEGFLNDTVDSYNGKSESVMKRAKDSDSLKIANSVWYRSGYTLLDGFRTLIEKYFMATSKEAAMNTDTVHEINQWAADNTDNLIKKIVDNISDDITSIVVNAVLFKGEWEEPFDKSATKKKKFTDATNTTHDVDMMSSIEENYYENEYATGFRKYYRDGYYFLAILPKK